jgi:hypothetical protein
MAEHDQKFETFDRWVNKASSWLTRRGPDDHAICYDTKGRLCRNGADFMRARDEGAFPVQWVWLDQVPEAMLAMEALAKASASFAAVAAGLISEIEEGVNHA